jgi:hypothetical protein
MRAKQFIIEAPATVQNKLNVITTKLSSGEVTDPIQLITFIKF